MEIKRTNRTSTRKRWGTERSWGI